MAPRMPTHERREQIVHATMALLETMPIDKVSTRRIAREVGISQPALFRHFQTTNLIFRAVVDQAREQIADRAEGLLVSDADPLYGVRHVVVGLATHLRTHPALLRLLFQQGPAQQSALSADLNHLNEMVTALIAQLLREGVHAERLPATLDVTLAARCLLATVHGLGNRWLADPSQSDLVDSVNAALQVFEAAASAGVPCASQPTAEAPALSEPICVLDVRPILSRGEDPLGHIMRIVEGSPSFLRVVAPFHPKPLVALLRKRGWSVQVVHEAPLYLVDACAADVIDVLYLAHLEAPQPLQHVLAKSHRLKAGERFVAHVPRLPRLVLPRLSGLGLRWSVGMLEDDSALLLVTAP